MRELRGRSCKCVLRYAMIKSMLHDLSIGNIGIAGIAVNATASAAEPEAIHVWTARGLQVLAAGFDRAVCVHVSGLFARL